MKLTIVFLIGALGAGCAAPEPTPRDGAAVFKARCARCHGDSGETDTSNARALKVRPLVNDAKLAQMAPADIGKAIKSNAKHQGIGAVVDLEDADLGVVAVFVKELAKKR